MKNIYLAAPFFDKEQISKRDKLAALLSSNPTVDKVFLPGEHEDDPESEFGSIEWQLATFKLDINQINQNDVVVAILDYDKPDSSDPGTIWECGYAFANNIPVIGVQFDSSNKLNLMLSMSLTAFFNPEKDIEDIKNYNFDLLQTRFSDYEVF
ncbi:nucleoside 2-deoxyribosyltransferase [Companilactobacillus sp. DQM5]|uniref:nucleoside 2-deoxyribosyltransferase n=1 Tax=Companilactobacillus sp. DQM5 TaxID=3463359 RepID=UPI00405852BA